MRRLMVTGIVLLSASAVASVLTTNTLTVQTPLTTSALSVYTKQVSVSASQQMDSARATAQQLATAIGAQKMTATLRQRLSDLTPMFGIPTSERCDATHERQEAVTQKRWATLEEQDRVMAFSGSRFDSYALGEQQAQERHTLNYCTVSEARQGLCQLEPNGLQGADVNYAQSLLTDQPLRDDQLVAAYNYAATVTDRRLPVELSCKTPQCQSAQAEHLQTAALSTLVGHQVITAINQRRAAPTDPY